MPVKSLELTGTPFSGDGRTRKHEFLLRVVNMTDDMAIEWLTTADVAIIGIAVQRPTGTFLSSLPSGEAPLLYEYTGRSLINVDYQIVADGVGEESAAEQVYRITATYEYTGGSESGGGSGNAGVPITGESGITFSFEIGPDNETFLYSQRTRIRYGPNSLNEAPRFQRAINVQSDGTIEGIQVPESPSQFTLEYSNISGWFTPAKRAQITRMRGKVNDRPMTVGGVTHQCGEVRFMGATGQVSNVGTSTISLRFGVIENRNDITMLTIHESTGKTEAGVAIGTNLQDALGANIFSGAASGIMKLGWDYLWVAYRQFEDDDWIDVKPIGAYVEQILLGANLNDIFV